jgi:hypothetical protein
MNVKLDIDSVDARLVYTVTVDGKAFCTTSDDDDAMALGIAIAQLQLKRKMEK